MLPMTYTRTTYRLLNTVAGTSKPLFGDTPEKRREYALEALPADRGALLLDSDAAVIVETVHTIEYPECTKVLRRAVNAGDVLEEDMSTVSGMMQRYLNMVGGCRPSDAMHAEVQAYRSMGREAYLAAAARRP